jgi:uncharacterized membrane protein YphA (DoxX/SURF4 family)
MWHGSSPDAILWALQILLAAVFAMAGAVKAFSPARMRAKQPSLAELSTGSLIFIGWSELLGGIGLILPRLTGVLPWLTPVAALGLALVMLLATVFHIRGGDLGRGEYRNVGNTIILCGSALAVACGRLLVRL